MMKEIRTNPLDQIEFWFTSLPLQTQESIAKFALLFHVDDTYFNCKEDQRIATFLGWLDSSDLNDKQIVSRTILAIKLIDFSFTGHRTEEDWQTILNRLITMRNLNKESGEPTGPDDAAIAQWRDNKDQALGIIGSWERFLAEELSDKQIMEWYFEPAFRKLK